MRDALDDAPPRPLAGQRVTVAEAPERQSSERDDDLISRINDSLGKSQSPGGDGGADADINTSPRQHGH